MALQKQLLPLPFAGGLDTKTDPKQVAPPKLIRLENATFISPGRLRKRPGYSGLPLKILNPPSESAPKLAAGAALASYLDELVLSDGTSLYSYDPSSVSFVRKGPLTSLYVTQQPIIRNGSQQTAQDGHVHPSGLRCFAWEDSSGGSRYCLVDGETGQTVVASTLLSVSGIKPKVLVLNNAFLILWYDVDSTLLNFATIAVTNPSVINSTGTLTTASDGSNSVNTTTPSWDAAIVGTQAGPQLYVAFNNANDSGLSVFRFAPNGLASGLAHTYSFAGGSGISWSPVTIFPGQGAPVVGVYAAGSVGLFVFDWNLNLLSTPAIETVADVVSITGVSRPALLPIWHIYYTVSASEPQNYRVRTNTVTGRSYTVGTPADFLRSVGLSGKGFEVNGLAYVPVGYTGMGQVANAAGNTPSLQPTYFVADQNGNLVAKLLGGNGGGFPVPNANVSNYGSVMLPESGVITPTQVLLPLLQQDLLVTVPGTPTLVTPVQNPPNFLAPTAVYTQTGVTAATLDFANQLNSWLRAELANDLHWSGGFLQMYDGQAPVELGFHVFPEPVAGALITSGGHLKDSSQYQYVACYEWTDNQGQIHRSAPSIPITLNTGVTTGPDISSARITIPTLRLSAKNGVRGPVVIQVYRTIANGTVFYSANSSVKPYDAKTSPAVNCPILSNPGDDAQNFQDELSDQQIQGNPQLYTTGNVVENIPPNAVSSLAVHNNRLFALDSTNPLSIWYSKQVVPGSPVEFSDLFTLSIDPKGGPITALAPLDDKLIVFKADRIFMVTGVGPDSTGGQNDFSGSILVTSDVGCLNPRSIVTMPNGLMFQSQKGIYQLDRGLGVTYIGAGVEAWNAQTVLSAQLLASTNQVRFTLAPSTDPTLPANAALVWDYFQQQWSVFTPVNAVDSAIWQEQYVYLQPGGAAWLETPGVFADPGGNSIKLRAVTSWIQLAGLQGFQRVWKALLLGDYFSPHTLLVQLAYDFIPIFVQQIQIPATGPNPYGDDSPYGNGTPYGGTFPLYQWRIFPQQQKCQAIQLSIEDVQNGTTGEALALSGLTLEVGLLPGARRIPSGSSFG